MNELREIKGYYGINNPIATIFVYGSWYVVEGSVNVNKCFFPMLLVDGVNIETLEDVDCYTSTEPIESLEQLKEFIDN